MSQTFLVENTFLLREQLVRAAKAELRACKLGDRGCNLFRSKEQARVKLH